MSGDGFCGGGVATSVISDTYCVAGMSPAVVCAWNSSFFGARAECLLLASVLQPLAGLLFFAQFSRILTSHRHGGGRELSLIATV